MRLRQFAILIEELQEQAKTMPPDELYDLVVERSGYVRALEEKNTAEDAARIENVQELKSTIIASSSKGPMILRSRDSSTRSRSIPTSITTTSPWTVSRS